MKYKVGDKVRVREDLEVSKEYGNDYVINSMLSLKGKIVTICNIDVDEYKIKEDFQKHWWPEEMFSGKVSEDFSSEEFDSQSTIPEGESSSDIITVKTTKIKLLLL